MSAQRAGSREYPYLERASVGSCLPLAPPEGGGCGAKRSIPGASSGRLLPPPRAAGGRRSTY